jgi:hypothetical protein
MSSIKRALKFGAGAALVFGLIGLWLWRRKHHPLAGEIVAGVGGAILLASVAAPSAVLALRAVWMKFAGAIGWVNSRILLGVFFFLIITPVALIRRLTGGSPLRWQRGEGTSYWRIRDQPTDPKHYEHPY